MRVGYKALVFLLALSLSGCFCGPGNKLTECEPNKWACVDQCKPIVNYEGDNISFYGVELNLFAELFTFADTQFEPKTVHDALEMVRVLDQNYSYCCNSMKEIRCASTIKEYNVCLDQMESDRKRLAKLADIIKAGDVEEFNRWVNKYHYRTDKMIEQGLVVKETMSRDVGLAEKAKIAVAEPGMEVAEGEKPAVEERTALVTLPIAKISPGQFDARTYLDKFIPLAKDPLFNR